MRKLRSFFLYLLVFELTALPVLARLPEKNSPKKTSQEIESEELTPSTPESPEKKFETRSNRASHYLFSTLPRHLGNDLKDSFWGWGSLGFALGTGLSVGLSQKDHAIQNQISQNQLFGKTGDKIFGILGSPYTLTGAEILTTIIAAKTNHPKLKVTGEAMLEAMVLSQALTLTLKYAVNRDRPDGSSHGFPSAHTTGAFSAATVLEVMYGPKVGIPAYAFASLVGISRIDDYKHFTSDVLMGATIGTVIGYGTAHFHKKNAASKFVLIPEIRRDGLSLSIARPF